MVPFPVVAKTGGRGRGVFSFQIVLFKKNCRYSPVLLFSNVRHLPFIYGGKK